MPRSQKEEKVLVLDGDMIPALTIARDLGRRGLKVVIACHEAKPIAAYSRFVHETLVYPNPLVAESEFLSWCDSILADNGYELVIPVTERTLVPMQQLLARPYGHTIAIAPPDALAVALDKDRTVALAGELEIPAPRTFAISRLSDLEAYSNELGFPVVIKPSRSIGMQETQRQHLSVDYAFDERQLKSKTRHLLRFGEVLLQELVSGQGVGIELIADRGEVSYAFQHLRLHEIPLTGGGSSLRKSVELEPELLEASRRLMKALDWHGVAMVEFKWNPETRSYWLIEINGRFWGSLPLAAAAGADFPGMLFELMNQGQVSPRKPARVGVQCRKLSSDIDWLELVVRRSAPAELVSFPKSSEIARDWLGAFSPRHNFDIQQWGDPLPGLVDFGRIVTTQMSRLIRLFVDSRALARQQAAWRRGHLAKQINDAKQILFVCYGNINRSALAQYYFQSIFPNTPTKAISAGFHQEEGRPADPLMIEVAAAKGVDLSTSSSKMLNSQMLADSDVLFVMELAHYRRICKEYPRACDKTFLLYAGAASDKESPEIADPYGKPRTVYEACARQIFSGVEHLGRLL